MNLPRTTVELFDMADKYAAASEAVEWYEDIDRKDKTSLVRSGEAKEKKQQVSQEQEE